jgi:6-pyruvoyltetrahydropterin/6-carboxytetrahydropterin synthase
MNSITRRFHFAMGHTLFRHEGGCANLHGHNYVAFVTITADELDSVGRVIDFADVKKLVGAFIDTQYDHRFLVNREDPRGKFLLAIDSLVRVVEFNPTAENLAHELLVAADEILSLRGLVTTRVVLWETENAYAEALRLW